MDNAQTTCHHNQRFHRLPGADKVVPPVFIRFFRPFPSRMTRRSISTNREFASISGSSLPIVIDKPLNSCKVVVSSLCLSTTEPPLQLSLARRVATTLMWPEHDGALPTQLAIDVSAMPPLERALYDRWVRTSLTQENSESALPISVRTKRCSVHETL